jgi:adenosylcobinamide-GDP ribazoletransferase
VRGLRHALGFLTRFPVTGIGEGQEEVAGAVPWFPVVGAILGGLVAAVYLGSSQLLPPLVAATLAVATGTVLTGGLHEDALGDLADALGAGPERQAAQQAAADPRLGTFGVLALGFGLLLRVGSLGVLDAQLAWTVVPAAHAASRTAMSWVLRAAPARSEGLGWAVGAGVRGGRLGAATMTGSVITGLLLGLWALPALGACLLVTAWLVALGRRRLGGMSGDVAGSVQQLSEIAVLLLAAAIATGGWTGPPWWP